MNTNLLLAILIALVPVFLTIIFSRRYNIFHGLVVFLVASYGLILGLDALGGKVPSAISQYFDVTLSLYNVINGVVVDLINKAGLSKLIANKNFKYILLGAWLVVFLISQIIATSVRRRRVAKINRLKRYLRRY